jgi:hypothetical protein
MDILVGVLSIAIGLLFCFQGFVAARLLMTIWGFFIGLMFGAGLVALFADGGFLGDVFGWIVGIAFGLLFGWLAYAYWAIAVIITIGSFGFTLTGAFLTWLGVDWNWLAIIAGLVVAFFLAYWSATAAIPASILMVITSLSGAGAVVWGLFLIFDRVSLDSLDSSASANATDGEFWWLLAYLGIAIFGMVYQGAFTGRGRRKAYDSWVAQ